MGGPQKAPKPAPEAPEGAPAEAPKAAAAEAQAEATKDAAIKFTEDMSVKGKEGAYLDALVDIMQGERGETMDDVAKYVLNSEGVAKFDKDLPRIVTMLQVMAGSPGKEGADTRKALESIAKGAKAGGKLAKQASAALNAPDVKEAAASYVDKADEADEKKLIEGAIKMVQDGKAGELADNILLYQDDPAMLVHAKRLISLLQVFAARDVEGSSAEEAYKALLKIGGTAEGKNKEALVAATSKAVADLEREGR